MALFELRTLADRLLRLVIPLRIIADLSRKKSV